MHASLLTLMSHPGSCCHFQNLRAGKHGIFGPHPLNLFGHMEIRSFLARITAEKINAAFLSLQFLQTHEFQAPSRVERHELTEIAILIFALGSAL